MQRDASELILFSSIMMQIVDVPGSGRCAVSAQSIPAGRVVLVCESPFICCVAAPTAPSGTSFFCTGCLLPCRTSSDARCVSCLSPYCSPDCLTRHKPHHVSSGDCAVFFAVKFGGHGFRGRDLLHFTAVACIIARALAEGYRLPIDDGHGSSSDDDDKQNESDTQKIALSKKGAKRKTTKRRRRGRAAAENDVDFILSQEHVRVSMFTAFPELKEQQQAQSSFAKFCDLVSNAEVAQPAELARYDTLRAGYESMVRNLQQHFEQDAHQDEKQSLLRLFAAKNVSPAFFHHVCSIYRCNAFGVFDQEEECGDDCDESNAHDSAQQTAIAVFLEASYFNHSCAPNLKRRSRNFSSQTSAVGCELHATRDIAAGEPLTISYIGDSLETTRERREHLLASYRFWCNCSLCRVGD